MGTGPNALNIEDSLLESVPGPGYWEDFELVSSAGKGTTASPFYADALGLDLNTARKFTFVCPGHIAPNTELRLVLTVGVAAGATVEPTIAGGIMRRDGTSASLGTLSFDTSLSAAARHESYAFTWAFKFSAGDIITLVMEATAPAEAILLSAHLRAKRHASLAKVRSRNTFTDTF